MPWCEALPTCSPATPPGCRCNIAELRIRTSPQFSLPVTYFIHLLSAPTMRYPHDGAEHNGDGHEGWAEPPQPGNYKYMVCIPFVLKAVVVWWTLPRSRSSLGNFHHVADNWCFYMLLLALVRYVHIQLWTTLSRLHCVNKKYLVHTQGISFRQVDQDHDWDNHIILEALIATAAHAWLPSWRTMPVWGSSTQRTLLLVLLMHCGPVEFVYYHLHRLLHSNGFLFSRIHERHHRFSVTESCTGGVRSWLEHWLLTALKALVLTGSFAVGGPSLLVLFCYIITFDFLQAMGHCNVEFVPASLFKLFPPLKFVLCTPSYHSLHHASRSTNFCLFMPLYDYLGGTRDSMTDYLHESLRIGRPNKAPDYVFLAHCIDMLSSPHISFVFRSLASHPYSSRWYLWLIWPVSVLAMLLLWAFGRTFVAAGYMLDSMSIQTWVLPRYGFHYFLPYGMSGLNKLIEQAILDADRLGVKVLSLAALNKNEALNGGGTIFVAKHTDLRVRVVHGNTLTAAVVVHAIGPEIGEVFLTGATSKLGRAIALYLCRRGVRVLMLTRSQERFELVVKDAPPERKHCLVQVTKIQAGQNCKTWIVGKCMSAEEQKWAPPNTYFHQFAVPGVSETRRDCSYGKLAGMRLPLKRIQGMNACELTMPRGVVHACHAGGIIHALEGWQHHEVGSIDVDRIDIVWEAALRHGFTPA